jgi:RHS repeat-associated core domain
VHEAKRLANAVIWRNPDGTLTARGYSAPVNYQGADGAWHAIDARLIDDGKGGLVNKAGPFSARLATDVTSSALVSLDDHGASLSVGFDGALNLDGSTTKLAQSRAVVTGEGSDTVTYADTLSNVDLRYQLLSTSLKEAIVLNKALPDGTTPQFKFTVRLHGLKASTADDGTIQFVNADTDKSVFTIPRGVAVDSAGSVDKGTSGATTGVSTELIASADPTVATLIVSVDSKWLADPARVFPVTIDPTLDNTNGGNATADAYVADTSTTTTFDGAGQYDSGSGQYWDRAGNAGGTNYYSYVALPSFSFMAGQKVVSATWNGYADSFAGGTSAILTLKPPSAAWSVTGGSPVTWSNQPALRTNSATATYTAASQWKAITITTWVTNWAKYPATGGWEQDGIRLSGPTTKVLNIASQEDTANHVPYVDVVYDAIPTMSDYTAGGQFTTGTVKTSTPTLAVHVTDTDAQADGQTLSGSFQLWNSAHTTLLQSGTGSSVQPDNNTTWTPASISDGTYKWRVQATDGTATTAWSAYQTLVIDTVAPATPTCQVGLWSNNTWNTPSGSGSYPVSFTETPTSDAYEFLYGVDTGNLVSDVLLAGASPVQVPMSWGWHDLACQTIDPAGNVSATVAHMTFGIGDGGFTKPTNDFDTQKQVPVQVVTKPSYDGIKLQWRHAEAAAWTDVSATDVIYKSTGTNVTWPVTATPGSVSTTFADLVWNAASTASNTDGPLQLNVEFYTGSTLHTPVDNGPFMNLNLNQGGFGSGFASAPAGPGQVNLLTGNFEASAGDVALAGGISRTFDSRAQNTTGSIFGPGWTSDIGGGSSQFRSLMDSGDGVVATTADGTEINFRRQSNGSYKPEDGENPLTLVKVSSTVFTLGILSFETYTFTHVSGSATGLFEPTAVDDSSGLGASSTLWQVVGTITRPTQMVAPAAPNVSCGLSPLTTRGCQSLTLDYASTTTATSGCGSPLGDYVGQLQKVHYTTWDPDLGTPAMRTVDVANYCYDTTTGRLASEWDPRISPALKVQYTYNGDGQLATLTPPGQNAWTFAYAPLAGETAGTGRLSTVSRMMPVGGGPTNNTSTSSFVYEVPLTTAAGGPFNLDPATTVGWSQMDNPTDATAIFPPNQTPSGSPPSDYTSATIFYVNLEGQLVNTAQPGGYIGTTEHDAIGNAIRSLSPANRALALSTGTTTASHAAKAVTVDDQTVYDSNGVRVIDAYGPAHFVDLPDGTQRVARQHIHNVYDEGAPGGATYGLLTTQTETATPIDGTAEQDARTTKNAYAIGTDTSGWTLGTPLQVTVDPGSTPHLNLTTTTEYDTTTGQMTSRVLPANPSGGDAHETDFIYYTAGTNSLDTACGNRPEWATLQCKKKTAAQPGTSGLPDLPTTQATKYSMYGGPEESVDTNGSDNRTTTIGYDAAGRPLTQSVTATIGTTLPQVTTAYDTSTGLLTTTGDGTRTISHAYNLIGQLSTYQDADGNTSTYTYDLLGRLSTLNDGKGTTTYTYDDVGTEHRGLLTTINDSQAGVFTTTYDANGQPSVETVPGGNFAAVYARNEAGEVVDLLYFNCIWCSTNDWPLLTASYNIHGQQTTNGEGLEAFTFTYDAASRLTHTDDMVLFGCSTRDYSYDADTNRTAKTTKIGAVFSGPCPPASAPVTNSSSYDAADRITTNGYSYDAFGRTLATPASDSPSGTVSTLGYYTNDLVNTMNAGGTTITYNLDPDRRVRTWISSVDSQTRTNHYTADSDSSAWTSENSAGTNWTRNVAGFNGLAAIIDQSGTVRLQLTNIRGDILSTTSTTETDWVNGLNSGSTSWTATDEYGNDETNGVPIGHRYDFQGTHQRQRDTNSGLQLMGQRAYNATSGRFLQTDPVNGGSSNNYDYTSADPVNKSDTTGQYTQEWVTIWGAYNVGWIFDFGDCHYFGVCNTANIHFTVQSTHLVNRLIHNLSNPKTFYKDLCTFIRFWGHVAMSIVCNYTRNNLWSMVLSSFANASHWNNCLQIQERWYSDPGGSILSWHFSGFFSNPLSSGVCAYGHT